MTIRVDGQAVSPDLEEEARRDVRLATRSAVYATDAAGVATDTAIKTALESAAIAQARALLRRDEIDAQMRASAALSPLGRPLASASIGGASYSVETGASSVPAPLQLDPRGGLCRGAYDILLDAGLIGGSVGFYG